MGEPSYRSWFGQPSHPAPDQLVAFVDGQLSQRVAQRIRKHLDRCWTCRAERDRLERAISAYMQYRRSAEGGEPVRIPDFEDRLRRYADGLPDAKQRRGPWMRWLVAPAAVSFAAAVLLVLPQARVHTVSAKELLERSAQAERRETASAAPIVYQKVAVRRTSLAGRKAAALSVEIWDHPARQAYRREVQPSGADPLDVADMERLLAANGMNPKRPLSAEGFARWRHLAPGAVDEVSHDARRSGAPGLRLRTTTTERRDGRIAEAELLVDTASWRPVFEKLAVLRSGGAEVYEITEVAYHVIQPKPAELAPQSLPAITVPTVQTDPLPAAPLHTTPVATEIQVRYALHRIGACLGEPVRVIEHRGSVRVEGVVPTAERKQQIVDAIATVEGASSVHLDLRTIAEAQRAAGTEPLPEAPAVSVEPDRFPLRDQLERALGTAAAATGFSAATVTASNQLMAEAWALRHLAARFAQPDRIRIPAQTRWLLEAMIYDHIDAIHTGAAALRRSLEPLITSAPAVPAAIQPETDWAHASLLLFQDVEAAHNVVLQAFAGSGEHPPATLDSAVLRLAGAEVRPATLKRTVAAAFRETASAATSYSTESPESRNSR